MEPQRPTRRYPCQPVRMVIYFMGSSRVRELRSNHNNLKSGTSMAAKGDLKSLVGQLFSSGDLTASPSPTT